MKNTSFAQNLLILLSFLILASGSSVTLLQKNTWPGFTPSWTYDGYYFLLTDGVGSLYNISTGQSWNVQQLVSVCDGGDYIVTSNFDFYCYSFTGGQIVWYQFSLNNFSVISKFAYKVPPNYVDFFQTDTYITYITDNEKEKTFTAETFNTLTREYVCNITAVRQQYSQYIDYTGYGLLYPSPNSNNQADFFPCEGTTPIISPVPTVEMVFAQGFSSFNQSTIYFGSGSNGKNKNGAQAALIDLTGSVYTGPEYNYQGSQYNDTHFVATYAHGGFWFVGLFTFGSTLNFINVANFNTSLSSDYLYFPGDAVPIRGSNNEVTVSLSGDEAYIYSFERQQIVAGYSSYPPFQLANGSVVNITYFGYLIQSPGEPIYFLSAPYYDVYVDPNLNDIWTLFLPNSLFNTFDIKNCYLHHFQINTSTITSYIYPKYPKIEAYPSIGDISYDEQGNPIVILLEEAIWVMSLDNLTKVMDAPNYDGMQVSVNMTNNTGTAVSFTNTAFMITKFYISSGSVYENSSWSVVAGEYQGNYVQKLSSENFLLASCNTSYAEFTIWNSANQIPVSNFGLLKSFIIVEKSNFTVKVIQYPVQAILGTTTNIVDAIIWVYVNELFIRDVTGNVTMMSFSPEAIYSINQLEYDTIWVYSATETAYYQRLYSI